MYRTDVTPLKSDIELSRLGCPKCQILLRISAKRASCPQCGLSGSISDYGSFAFEKSDWYYGVMPKDVMHKFLKKAVHTGWRKAAETCIAKRYPSRAKNLSDDVRADWNFLLNLQQDDHVLDVGAGFGTLSFAIAQDVGSVWAVEKVCERFEFIRLRAKQDGIHNVIPVSADALRLPFMPKSFTVALVVGLMEWLGLSSTENPRKIQLSFLRHLRQLLAKNGRLLLGIENRFGLEAIRGALDHSQLRYTSLMPRFIQGKGKGYRTYTYGPFALKKLLLQAGFKNGRLYCAIPSYREPHTLIPLEWPGCMQTFLDNPGIPRTTGWVKVLRNIKLTRIEAFIRRWFTSHFIVVAEKGD